MKRRITAWGPRPRFVGRRRCRWLGSAEGGSEDGHHRLPQIRGFRSHARQLADDHGIDQDRLYQVNIRGRRNPFTHPKDREVLLADLRSRGVESLVVDPFGRAYPGKSQNDPGEVGSWFVDLDLFVRPEVGAKDVILTAHAGWNG